MINITKDLEAVVEHVRKHFPRGTQTDWHKVKELLGSDKSIEALRSEYRRVMDPNMTKIIKERYEVNAGRITTEQKLLALIKRKHTMDSLCEKLEVEENDILIAVAKLHLQGYRGVRIYDEGGVTFVHNRVTVGELRANPVETAVMLPGKEIEFAVVSDAHFGSVYSAVDELHEFYDIVQGRGIKVVFNAGDMTDGYYNNRPTSILEQDAIGFTNQLNKVVNEYPRRDGVTTYFITGNHDLTHQRNAFANIGEAISMVRDDMIYSGHNFAKFEVNEDVSISLVHPTDGISRNFNNKIRDLIDRNPNRRADLMFVGHYHKLAMLKHQDVYGYIVPSFQRQTGFMQDNNLESVVGGMIVRVKVNAFGKIESVVTEVIEL